MKISGFFASLILVLASTGMAFSANPVSSKAAIKADSSSHQFNLRLRNQWMLIMQGLKSGKLTKEQAASLRADLKNTRQQEIGFFKLNQNHTLTSVQQNQLNAALDKNSNLLGEPSTR